MTRIYADFNGITSSPRNPARKAVPLDTWGSVRDLCDAGLRLRDGLAFTIFDRSDDKEDLEGSATVYHDPTTGIWMAELVEPGYQYVPARDCSRPDDFRCQRCRKRVHPKPGRSPGCGAGMVGRMLDLGCPACGFRFADVIARPGQGEEPA